MLCKRPLPIRTLLPSLFKMALTVSGGAAYTACYRAPLHSYAIGWQALWATNCICVLDVWRVKGLRNREAVHSHVDVGLNVLPHLRANVMSKYLAESREFWVPVPVQP